MFTDGKYLSLNIKNKQKKKKHKMFLWLWTIYSNQKLKILIKQIFTKMVK